MPFAVDLPKAASQANPARQDNIQLALDDRGQLFWNGEELDAARFSERPESPDNSPPLLNSMTAPTAGPPTRKSPRS